MGATWNYVVDALKSEYKILRLVERLVTASNRKLKKKESL
jgi:hypothetical protein